MKKRALYRSDARPFLPGEAMPPPGDHFDTLSTRQKEVELLFRNGHPNGHVLRSKTLYTFPEQSRAEKYWALQVIRYQRNFYAVVVDEVDILHVGDVSLYNHLVQYNVSPLEAQEYVRRYWNGEAGPTPDIEYIVRDAFVVEQLGDFDAQKVAFDKKYRIR